MIAKLSLAHLPTPLWRSDALDALVGTQVWVKRDDMTAGAEAGNKIRKLEYLLADALNQGATTVMTCGGLQSNHARATALVARGLGLGTMLLLRTADEHPSMSEGNAFLDRLAGAEIIRVTPAQWSRRQALMKAHAERQQRDGERVYVIPEGGSNALGALGYVDAMREVRAQLDAGLGGGPTPFDAVVHACGSGGTAAGVALGARRWDVAANTLAMAVCDDSAYFRSTVSGIIEAASPLCGIDQPNEWTVIDRYKGPAYGVASEQQLAFIVRVARMTGLVLDPVYSGKALYALSVLADKPDRVLFIHTGGLPGLLADTASFAGYV